MKKLLLVICASFMVAFLGFGQLAYADIPEACAYMDPSTEFYIENCTDDIDGEAELVTIIKNILNFIYGIIGIIAVCVIVYSGILMISSAGDPAKIVTAKKAIIGAVIGLVITVLAFAITNFFIGAIGGK